MPSTDQHLIRAAENRELAIRVAQDPSSAACDWAVTILFYAALHLIDAYLAAKGQHPPDHESRDNIVASNGSLAAIYRDYRRLKRWSNDARYDIACFRQSRVGEASALVDGIRAHIGTRLR